MTERYLLPKARCEATGEVVKSQDLTGARFTLAQRAFAEEVSQQLADKMSARTRRVWVGFVEEYTPTYRRG